MALDEGTGARQPTKRKRTTLVPTLGSRLAERLIAETPAATPSPSPDVRDRAAETRSANASRGAAASGGPGRATRARARKVLDRRSVKEMQAELRREGYAVPTHGRWDKKTASSWKEYATALGGSEIADLLQREQSGTPDPQADLTALGFTGASELANARLADRVALGAKQDEAVGSLSPAPASGPLGQTEGGIVDGLASSVAGALANPASFQRSLTGGLASVLQQMTPENAERLGRWLYENPTVTSFTDTDDDGSVQLAAAGLSPELTTRVAQVWGESAKTLATDPGKGFGDLKEIAVGTAQLLGALASSPHDNRILGELARGFVQDYRNRYGSNWQAYAKDDPLFNLLDMAAATGAVTRLPGITKSMRQGATLKEALWESYNPSRTGKVRTLERPEAGTSASFQWGRSPVSRTFQRAYDLYSEVAPDRALGSKAKRIDRQNATRYQRGRAAKEAQIAPLIAKVRKPDQVFSLQNDVARTRLWWESQLPPAFRSNEGLQMVRAALLRELEQLEFGDGTPTDLQNATLLKERLRELDDAISYTPTKRYQQALAATDELSDFIEETEARAFSYEGFFMDPDARNTWIEKLTDEIERLEKVRTLTREVVPPENASLRGPGSALQRKRLAFPGNPKTTLAWLDTEIADLQEHLRMLETKDYGRAFERPQTPDEAAYPIEGRRTFPDEAYPTYLTYEEAVARTMAKFRNRRTIMGEWVTGEDAGIGAYMKHQRGAPPSGLSGGGSFQTTTGTILSDADLSPLDLNRQNLLRLVRSGQVAPDPEHTVMRALKVLSLEMMNKVRGDLWERGQEIPRGTIPNEGDFIVRQRGRTKPEEWVLNENAHDAEALRASLEGYRKDFMAEVGPEALSDLQARGWLGPQGEVALDGIRVIPRAEVERLFHFLGGSNARRILGEASKGGQVIDFAEGFTKLAILYANPGYYPANLLGNMVFLALHQGPLMVRSLADAGRLHADDAQTWGQISGEMGQGAATAYMGTAIGTGKLERGLNVQRRIAHGAGFVDRGPRVAAWIHEARRQGYKNPSDWKAILRAHDDAEALAAREAIRLRAERAMVDFDAMTPFEKTYLRRIIFVYPWLRGSAAWTAHFAAEFPERAAGLATGASTAHDLSEENLNGNVLPSWLESSFVRGVEGGVGDVMNLGGLSPLSTLSEGVTMFGRDPREPVPEHHSFWDLANPLIQDAIQIFQGQDEYGRNVSYTKALTGSLPDDIVPGLSIAEDLLDPENEVSRVYADNSPVETLKRRGARVFPFKIDLRAARQAYERENPEPADKRPDVLQRLEEIEEVYRKIGEPFPEEYRRIGDRLAVVAIMEENLKNDQNLRAWPKDPLATAAMKAAVRLRVIANERQALELSDDDIADYHEAYEAARGSTEAMEELLSDFDEILGKRDYEAFSEEAHEIADELRAEQETEARGDTP